MEEAPDLALANADRARELVLCDAPGHGWAFVVEYVELGWGWARARVGLGVWARGVGLADAPEPLLPPAPSRAQHVV